jgi:hypothetical protein
LNAVKAVLIAFGVSRQLTGGCDASRRIVYSRRTRDGIGGDHILVCPPLIVTDTQIDEILGTLDRSLTQFTGGLSALREYD